jgi:Subtilase family.
MLIAVIDDGVNEKFYNIGKLKYDIEIMPNLRVVDRVGYDSCLPSHGTTCAAIIKKYLPNASLCSVKVLGDNFRGLKGQLAKALEWCTGNGIRLVNISLGSTDFRDYDLLKSVVNNAYKKGLVIVAACNNRNIITYPASLSSVIGVRSGRKDMPEEDGYQYNSYPYDGIEVTAYASHFLISPDGEGRNISPSNSFAAPFITALVHDIMQKYPGVTVEGIKQKLYLKAGNSSVDDYNPYIARNADWVEKAAIFELSVVDGFMCATGYAFVVKETVKIKCISAGEGFRGIKDFIYWNKASLDNIDTIVVLLARDLECCSADEAYAFMHELGCLGKNLLYLHDGECNCSLDFSNRSIDSKLWYPDARKYFNANRGKENTLRIPLIVFYNATYKITINIIKEIVNFFRGDGYHAVAVSNSCLGIATGIEFLHAVSLEEYGEDGYITELASISNSYDADILLLELNAFNGGNDYIHRLERLSGVDISIFIVDENCYAKTVPELSSEASVFLCLSEEYIGEQYKESKIFYYNNGSTLYELYKYILNLFETDKCKK